VSINTPAKEPYISEKELYNSAKEPYISEKELYNSAKEPYIRDYCMRARASHIKHIS